MVNGQTVGFPEGMPFRGVSLERVPVARMRSYGERGRKLKRGEDGGRHYIEKNHPRESSLSLSLSLSRCHARPPKTIYIVHRSGSCEEAALSLLSVGATPISRSPIDRTDPPAEESRTLSSRTRATRFHRGLSEFVSTTAGGRPRHPPTVIISA